MKKLLAILLCSGLLCPYVYSVTDAAVEVNQEIAGLHNRLNLINQELGEPLPDEERAKLLYERAYVMLTTFWEEGLKSGTEDLLEAIKLIPEEKGYKDFLYEVYEALWKDKEFSDDESGRNFQEIKEKVKAIVEEYKGAQP